MQNGTRRSHGAWKSISQQLQDEIFSGRLQPREHLIEDDIIDRTGASRHAVRRALDDLVSLGLATSLPSRGTRIRGYSGDEVRHLYEVREILEQSAARRIPLPATPQLIKQLKSIEAEHKEANLRKDLTAVFETNGRFHEALYAASGNPTLCQAIADYARQTLPIRMRYVTFRGKVDEPGKDHDRMIELMQGRDAEALAQLCYDHLQPSKAFYLSTVTW